MYDPTPAPYGTITRRWTGLSDSERDRQAIRLVGVATDPASIEEPEGALNYRHLLSSAVDGDPCAFAWLATSHRAFLIARGRDLFFVDATEWGAVCLELLHDTFRKADLDAGRWLRRQVVRRLSQALGARARRLLAHREEAVDPAVLDRVLDHSTAARHATGSHRIGDAADAGSDLLQRSLLRSGGAPALWAGDHADPAERLDLQAALTLALDSLDPPTRDAFLAMAEGDPVTKVADLHQLSHQALWQRVHRARERIQPELAEYRRAVA